MVSNTSHPFKTVTALVTPLHRDYTIDTETLYMLIARQIEAGNTPLFFGSTGEGRTIPEQEQLTFLRNYQGDSATIWVGVASITMAQALYAMGIYQWLVAPPPYLCLDPPSQRYYFTTWLTTFPKAQFLLYNVPSRTGTHLTTDTYQALAHHTNIWGIKECHSTVQRRLETPKKWHYLLGNDADYVHANSVQADGIVSVATNLYPDLYHTFDPQTWSEAIEPLRNSANPATIKRLLAERFPMQNVLYPPLQPQVEHA